MCFVRYYFVSMIVPLLWGVGIKGCYKPKGYFYLRTFYNDKRGHLFKELFVGCSYQHKSKRLFVIGFWFALGLNHAPYDKLDLLKNLQVRIAQITSVVPTNVVHGADLVCFGFMQRILVAAGYTDPSLAIEEACYVL